MLDEHTQILRALEYLAQVNKSEHDRMFNDIAHLKGEAEANLFHIHIYSNHLILKLG